MSQSAVRDVATPLEGLLSDPALGTAQRQIAAGSSLFEPGDLACNLHYIHGGQVRVYQVAPDRSERLLEILGPGQWCGVESLTHRGAHVQRAVAVVDSTVSDIPVATLHSVLARQPDVAIGLIRHLATRLQDARDDAARLVFDDCNQRLLKTLVRFSESAAATRHENDVVLRITHQQLAQAVGAARETISLALTQLRQRNLLHTGRNRLTFNAQVLRGLVERTVSPCAGVADENGSDSNASVRSADSAAAQSAPQQPRTQAAQVA